MYFIFVFTCNHMFNSKLFFFTQLLIYLFIYFYLSHEKGGSLRIKFGVEIVFALNKYCYLYVY